MRFAGLALFLAWSWWPALGAVLNVPEIEKIADTMVRLCVEGGRTEATTTTATLPTDLSLRSLDDQGNVKGEFKISDSSAQSLQHALDNALTRVAVDQADRVAACLQPVQVELQVVKIQMLEMQRPKLPAPPPRPGSVVAEAPEAADNAEYLVWYGTNRRQNDPGDASKGYSGARDPVVHYGSCRVFVPKSHKIGSTGSPWWKRLVTLTDDRLRLLGISELEQRAYWSGVDAHLAAVGAEERNALIFVHGYNVSFEDAALRAAQIGFDLSIKGAMAFFRGRSVVTRPTRRRSRRARAPSPIS